VPHRNRVDPFGALIATSARGTLMGNRGCLHDASGAIRRDGMGKRWIACLLAFKGRKRAILRAGRYTELFFLDEATALSAGHRPCAECRRDAYRAFRKALARAGGPPDSAPVSIVDDLLHGARLPVGPARPTWRAPFRDLPDGTMVMRDGAPHLLWRFKLRRWSREGYGPAGAIKTRDAAVLTPRLIVGALAAGYRCAVHPNVA
jgi:hypothetical protein